MGDQKIDKKQYGLIKSRLNQLFWNKRLIVTALSTHDSDHFAVRGQPFDRLRANGECEIYDGLNHDKVGIGNGQIDTN